MMNEAGTLKDARIDDYIASVWYCYAGEIEGYLRRVASIDDVEDLLQIVFMRLSATLLRDPQGQPERLITNMRAYLYTIARHVGLEALRNDRKRITLTVSSDTLIDDEGHSILDLLPDRSRTPEEAFLGREQILDLYAQIGQLPDLERAVLSCTYFMGMTTRETSVALNLSERTVSRAQSNAKQRLRKGLLPEIEVNEERLPKKKFTYGVLSSLDYDKGMPMALELASTIAQLPDPYRSVLTLAILEGRKYTQIAALRHCPLGTIKGQISRGMRLLEGYDQPVQVPTSMPQQVSITPRELPHLDALPKHYRTILILREVHGSSYKQIAKYLEIPLSDVKKRLHRARTAYHALLNQQLRQPRTTYRDRSLPLEEFSHLNHPAYQHFYEVLHLAYIEHLSNDEIAARLHRPVGTIKAHLARGIQLLTPIETSEEQER